MTQDDIIRMAREVGFVAYGEDAGEYRIPTPAFHNRLKRFAALAAAAEREACADICDQHASVEGIAQRCAEQIRARSKT
jgi:UDP-N-acetylmuramate-alanine ligase